MKESRVCCAFILTTMDLPQIGAHCSLPSCNALDFLPIVCQCKASFCSLHISPDLHACRAVRTNNNTNTASARPRQRCAFEACQKPSLPAYDEIGCAICHKSFCTDHRHPETHRCPSQPIPPKSKSSVVIQKSSRLPSAKPPTDPSKLLQWRKMELMKMRHRAVCGDPKDKTASLPPDQRLHVKIHHQDTDKVFWFRKNVITGRALDLLVNQLGLTFPESSHLKLCNISLDKGESISLQNDQPLASQVEDGSMLAICPVK